MLKRALKLILSHNRVQSRLYCDFKGKLVPNKASIEPSEIVSILVKNLKCKENEAKKLVKNIEAHNSLSLSDVTKQIEVFLAHGIDSKVLLKYPEVIFMNPNVVNDKLELLKQFPVGENGKGLTDYLPFLTLDENVIKKYKEKFAFEAKSMPKGSRIHYLSDKLSVEPHIVTKIFCKYNNLVTISDCKLFTNMELLLGYKISSEQILRNPKVFEYKTTFIKSRLDAAKKMIDNKDLKPWMMYVSEKKFVRSMRLTLEKQVALKEVDAEDELEFFSTRLGYERTKVEKYLKEKCPKALRVRILTLRPLLDFLLDEAGYTPKQIIAVPHIFTHSLEKIKKRRKELKALKCDMPMLSSFCLSVRNYEKLITKLKKKKLKETES